MIYIYSNGDFHTDKDFAGNVLKLGEPIKTLTEQEFQTYDGQVRIIDEVLVLGKTDAEKTKEALDEQARVAQRQLNDTDYVDNQLSRIRELSLADPTYEQEYHDLQAKRLPILKQREEWTKIIRLAE
jgi:hypothetical protein